MRLDSKLELITVNNEIVNLDEIEKIKKEILFETIFENIDEGVIISDLNDKFILGNSSSEKIFGVKPGELIGRDLSDFMDNMNKNIVLEQTQNRLEYKSSSYDIQIKVENITKNLSIIATPLIVDEKVANILVFIKDITAKLEILRKLEKSERKYRKLIEHAPLGIVILNLNGDVLEINNPNLEMFGGKSEIQLFNLLNFPPAIQNGFVSDFEEVILTGKQNVVEKKYVNRDGNLCFYRIHLSTILNENKKISGVQLIVEDITKRKFDEDGLKTYKTRLEQNIAERESEIKIVNNYLKSQIDKRKVIEKQLIEKEKFEYFYKNNPCIFFVLNAHALIVDSNLEFAINKNFLTILNEDEHSRWAENYKFLNPHKKFKAKFSLKTENDIYEEFIICGKGIFDHRNGFQGAILQVF
jgi:PAS domain S-box-containing protein